MAWTQVGIEWKHDFASFAITGYMPTSLVDEIVYDRADVLGQDAETITKLGKNKKRVISGSLQVKASVTEFPEQMDIISVTVPESGSVKFFVEKWTPTYSNDICTCAIELVREDSMTATYDA